MLWFKVGITDFLTGEKSISCISNIVKDLAAMANTKPGEKGTVILGVSDNDKDAKKVSKRFGIKPIKCDRFSITGIKEEAEQCFGGLDNYLNFIRNYIEKEEISDVFKNEILKNIRIIRCGDKLLVLFTAQAKREVYYNKELFVRHGNHNTPVPFDSELQHNIIDTFSNIRNITNSMEIFTSNKLDS